MLLWSRAIHWQCCDILLYQSTLKDIWTMSHRLFCFAPLLSFVCPLWHHHKKDTNNNTVLHILQILAYAPLKPRHQTFLQTQAVCDTALRCPFEAKGFQTISRFCSESTNARALHIHSLPLEANTVCCLLLLFSLPAKPLTKVTNYLPSSIIQIRTGRCDDRSARQLAPSFVAISAYVSMIIKM